MGAYLDLPSANSLLKEWYSADRVESPVYDGGIHWTHYLDLTPAMPYRWPRSKSRRHYRRQEIAVAQDVLHQCGLWPFKRSDWHPDLRGREDKAQDIIGRGLVGWLPNTRERREEIRVELERTGLYDTAAAQRFFARPVSERSMFASTPVGARLMEPIVLK